MPDCYFEPNFPIDGLTSTLADAARFIALTNQSPIEMCASSVLAAASLACQGLEDVNWREGAISTTGLIIFIEAESGERKTANDAISFRVIRAFVKQQTTLARAEQRAHEIELKLWNLKVKQLQKSIAKRFQKALDSSEQEWQLKTLLEDEPVNRQRAQLLLTNVTRQALAVHLSKIYPYAAIISDEGAAVTNSDALGDVGMLNTLADGGYWSSDRVTRERIELEGNRLMVYLQIQPGILEDFLRRRGKALHLSGFSSRWLFVRPKSTQGARTARFVEKPTGLIEPFDHRLEMMLREYEGPKLPTRGTLKLSEAAKELLDDFAQKVEVELASGGWFSLMKGQGAKAAERAAVVAAVMHKFEGSEGEILVHVMRGAIKIVAWFLNQHRMRFCPLSQAELDAQELEECISRHAYKFKADTFVEGPTLCRLAPLRMRQKDDLLLVLAMLEQQGKVKVRHYASNSWRVDLPWWHPWPNVRPAPPREPISNAFSRWREEAPLFPQPVQTPQVDSGYLLWPGVYLPE